MFKAILFPASTQLNITQWEVYETLSTTENIAAKEALQALLNWLKNNNTQKIFTQTQILIAPGYSFRIAKAIITNFHQPQSTLLLLVAAAVGNNWREIYEYALQNDFRFFELWRWEFVIYKRSSKLINPVPL
ncbi:MAG: S-adenosylmethionine:tRNA ribosyltransferase-isomerase [Ferruginibacter sp.]